MTIEEILDGRLISERKLAAALGVSESAVRKWKRENAVPLDRVRDFAGAIGVPVEEIPATTGVRGRPPEGPRSRAVWYCAVAGETYERRPEWCDHDASCDWRWFDA